MEFKYYDVLSGLVVGYVLLICILFCFRIEYDENYTLAYIACGFALGYVINAIASLLEPFYFFTIGGKPSSKLLESDDKKKGYTGIKKVRFYHSEEVKRRLCDELNDESASADKLFSKAMIYANSAADSRVPDFNAHYAYSRTFLTMVLIMTIMIIVFFPNKWVSYLMLLLLLLCWNRYRERAYYYAREVLNEYIKQTIKK